MKIKTDFITNSSSSSYIIAIKNELSVKDIKKILIENKESLENLINDISKYMRNDDEEDEIFKLPITEKKINAVAEDFAKEILSLFKYNPLEIGGYKVTATEGSSEDIDPFSNWLYSYQDIKSNDLIIRGVDL